MQVLRGEEHIHRRGLREIAEIDGHGVDFPDPFSTTNAFMALSALARGHLWRWLDIKNLASGPDYAGEDACPIPFAGYEIHYRLSRFDACKRGDLRVLADAVDGSVCLSRRRLNGVVPNCSAA